MSAPGIRLGVRLGLAAAAVSAILAVDLATKRWAAETLRTRGPRPIVPGHLAVRYKENPGAVFGVLSGLRAPLREPLLAGISLGGVAVTLVLLARRLRRPAPGRLLPAGLGALLAGTLGNLHDRLARGWVIDFIDWRVAGRWRWPTFNVADVAISTGIVLCFVYLGRELVRSFRAGDDEPPRPAGA